jgi:hypothetical protein
MEREDIEVWKNLWLVSSMTIATARHTTAETGSTGPPLLRSIFSLYRSYSSFSERLGLTNKGRGI